MKQLTINHPIKFLNKYALFIVVAILFMGPLTVFADATANPYDIKALNTHVSGLKGTVKELVGYVVGIIFLIGMVHVIIAFVTNNQNIKNIVITYLIGFVFFGLIWTFLV